MNNKLLELGIKEIEQVLDARKLLSDVARRHGLSLQPHATQVVHRRSPNGSNGHNGHRPRKAKMSQDVRNRISASMRKLWQKRRKAEKTEAAPA